MLRKSIKQSVLQAIELNNIDDSWFTLVIIFTIILLAILKLIKPSHLFGHTVAFFTPGFFQKKAEEEISIFNPFSFTLFLYSSIIIALSIFGFTCKKGLMDNNFTSFSVLLICVFIYLLSKFIIEMFIVNALAIKERVNYFLHLKYGYLFTVCLLILPVLIVYKYAINSNLFLFTFLVILLIFRATLIIFNNKNIVISKLFYFILYFCTLEIAPLLLLYKTTTT
ncbi:DUF4271 domain-containing protein [Tenacibaculum vairaonense]|uniref:DUF4271 domain-containing protein n=1 Tax=Tenacibaculum vairaonense TaxID=3137860 RepID=UPI00399D6703